MTTRDEIDRMSLECESCGRLYPVAFDDVDSECPGCGSLQGVEVDSFIAAAPRADGWAAGSILLGRRVI